MKRQVYQKLRFPVPLSKDEYELPYAGSNLEGTLDKAYALFNLVDPQSVFARAYSPTALSFSMSYKRVIHNIEPVNDSALEVVSRAKEKLREDKEITLGIFTRAFSLVETIPYNWYKTDAQSISFTVGPPDSDADYVELGAASKRQVDFNGFAATILRPWFDNRVFGNENWIINGYGKGAISSGTYVDNDGALPLIPVQLLIAVDKGGYRLDGVISDLVPLTPAKSAADVDRTSDSDFIDGKRERPLIFVDKFGRPVKRFYGAKQEFFHL